ncbi:hypothetical protein PGIGA_G00056540 [Pangasianodon gigas]|uniref:Uncharacterized protein n=1 Tax=Pangasianodon gigas TaxID=30993 RepID=A0ACC5X3U9_PANGG|nr:hypothetical protein [Pangasianodon gigas]
MKHSLYVSHHSFALPPTLSLLRRRVIVSATSCATTLWNCRPFPVKDTVVEERLGGEEQNRGKEKVQSATERDYMVGG